MTVALGPSADAALPPLIPKPAHVRAIEGPSFVLTRKTVIVAQGGCRAAHQLQGLLEPATGWRLAVQPTGGNVGSQIVFRVAQDAKKLKPDWYWLTCSAHRITVEYSTEAGAFYAVQTLRQLLPTQIEGKSPVRGLSWRIPALEIEDGPRFGWRGMLLDCSRHFFSVEFIKKTIDRLAAMKMNVLHWHLVDDGGWRLEIKKYPRLTDVGAWRADTGEVWPGGEWNFGNLRFVGKDGAPRYGGYYRQEEVREIVRYAQERHVTIVPEIELPGHSLAAVVAYPWLACQGVGVAPKPGMSLTNVYCAGNDRAITFLEDVLTETLALFPSLFIHIGADEVAKEHWRACPLCQERMKREGLKDTNELQSWVVRHFDRWLSERGRRLVGWDEILEGGLAHGATVMSWRGVEGGISAAKQGKDVVMCPTSACYFDYDYETTPTEKVYQWEPVPPALRQDAGRVLGGQYNVWTEWIASETRCEEMQYPRALAMAEVLWSPKDGRDWLDFSTRLQAFTPRLDALGVNYTVSPPEAPVKAVFFRDLAIVRASATGRAPLRYTLDGSLPDSASPLYKEPLELTRPCTVTFATVAKSGHRSRPVAVTVARMPQQLKLQLEPGLQAVRWKLDRGYARLSDIPRTGSSDTAWVDFPRAEARPANERFLVQWRGYLKVPKDATYSFSLSSDDGSALTLAGVPVVDNDGAHATATKTGAAWLPAGVYPLQIEWFDQGGANAFQFKASAVDPGAEAPVLMRDRADAPVVRVDRRPRGG